MVEQERLNVFVELNVRSNMRFLKFEPIMSDEAGERNAGKDERDDDDDDVNLWFMFRPAFIAGRSFSASMLDTLLYQARPLIFISFRLKNSHISGCRVGKSCGFD